ncbi:hypothetical protein GCM10023068_00030 [Leifsonia shinshuensis]
MTGDGCVAVSMLSLLMVCVLDISGRLSAAGALARSASQPVSDPPPGPKYHKLVPPEMGAAPHTRQSSIQAFGGVGSPRDSIRRLAQLKKAAR